MFENVICKMLFISSRPQCVKDKTSLSFLVDTMAADDLTPHWAKSSTAMVLV